jgi:hypothetical protein
MKIQVSLSTKQHSLPHPTYHRIREYRRLHSDFIETPLSCTVDYELFNKNLEFERNIVHEYPFRSVPYALSLTINR